MASFERKCEKLGISDEVQSIIDNCECGEINCTYLVDLDKLRRWEIIEVLGNFLDPREEEVEDWMDIRQLKTFCKAFDISEDEVSSVYASAISEEGCSIAYAITDNIVLIIE